MTRATRVLGSALRRDSSASSNVVELDDALGVWRKLIEMASGADTVIRRTDTVSLRPPLESDPEQASVALPACVDWFPSAEQNRAVYRFLALQLAGRREFGSYAAGADGRAAAYLRVRRSQQQASPLEALFLLTEGLRVQHRVVLAYPGSARETAQLTAALLVTWHAEAQPSYALACDTLLAFALAPEAARMLPVWLPPSAAERVLQLLTPLQEAHASAEDSLAVALALAQLLATPIFRRAVPAAPEAAAYDDETRTKLESVNVYELARDGASIVAEAEPAGLEPHAGAQPAQAVTRSDRAQAGLGQPHDGSNADADMPLAADSDTACVTTTKPKRVRRSGTHAQTFLYDEWDHTIADFRSRHCRVHEVLLPSDSGAFFERTLRGYADLLAAVKRQYERMRPERYRRLHGLEDGEDFDLDALTEARIELRARRTPGNRIYTARTRQARDVATLFLLDMSASTEQPFAEPGDNPPPRRIIDTLKEALVVMSTALDRLGDDYAIYGFSSHGAKQVEVYPIKAFDEALNHTVKARIGGIQPRNGTRMGAALRHAIPKFASVHARSKHLVLLSDGFPQDQEYGPDRRSHTYGIEDTAVALREVRAAGATPFCITVDRAGHDYLRRMCDATQYLVIDDLDALPRELPKIYRRVVQS